MNYKLTPKLKFLQRLEEKCFITGSIHDYEEVSLYKVYNQELYIIYIPIRNKYKFSKDLFHSEGNPYITLEEFIENIIDPSLKKELLFNLNLLQ